jgi:hypothetical protein
VPRQSHSGCGASTRTRTESGETGGAQRSCIHCGAFISIAARTTRERFAPLGQRFSQAMPSPSRSLPRLALRAVQFLKLFAAASDGAGDLAERRLDRGDLGEDVDAVAVVGDHGLDAADLALPRTVSRVERGEERFGGWRLLPPVAIGVCREARLREWEDDLGTKGPALRGFVEMRRRGLEPPAGYPGPGPRPGERTVLASIPCQIVRYVDKSGRIGRSGCCHGLKASSLPGVSQGVSFAARAS